ncbi:MAG: molybdenum cofactor guanylyltransferase [Deltaproteobacteria bacterium]|nr:molybdenum cofactor guanylyltransferase [Deltaproteobacteria bacterium]
MTALERSGLLLAGGRSSRMGRPKALLDLAGEPLVAHAARSLFAVCDEVVLAVAPREQADDAYIAALADAVRGVAPQGEAHVLVVRDAEAFRGPVGGLATALAAARGRLAIAVACDTPFVARPLLEGLFARAEAPCEYDVVLPVRDGRPEPLLAVYRVATAGPHFARRLAQGGGRPTNGLSDALRVRTIEGEELRALDSDEASFANVNSPDELETARSRLASLTARGSRRTRSRTGSSEGG